MPNFKLKRQVVGTMNRVDRMSNLPDEVVSRIFSFLCIKDIVRTSVLSKRWEYAWADAPCLDFSYSIHGGNSESKIASFNNFVDRVLFHHGSSAIQKCTLDAPPSDLCPSFSAWIYAVLACNVQELHLSSCSYINVQLPPSIFTSKTLVVLEISEGFLLNLPFRVCFPSLKKLSLKSVIYVDDFSMQRLFSSCPVLEELKIMRHSIWDGVLVTSISVPSLKRLMICMWYPLETLQGYGYKMVINAPRLEYLQLHDGVSEKVSLSFSDSLDKARIDSSCVSKVLNQVSHVKELSLGERTIENLNLVSDFVMSIFHNLTSLRMELDRIPRHNLLSDFLSNSPNLEVFSLEMRTADCTCYSGNSPWNPPESPPVCLLNLKRFEFLQFMGTVFERSLVKYMLENALVLEKMVISVHYLSYTDCRRFMRSHKEQVRSSIDEILDYSKSSSICEVTFEDTLIVE